MELSKKFFNVTFIYNSAHKTDMYIICHFYGRYIVS